MRIFLYNEKTLEKIKDYESDIAPVVGDFYTQSEIEVGPGEVIRRILHIDLPHAITLHVKVSEKIF